MKKILRMKYAEEDFWIASGKQNRAWVHLQHDATGRVKRDFIDTGWMRKISSMLNWASHRLFRGVGDGTVEDFILEYSQLERRIRALENALAACKDGNRGPLDEGPIVPQVPIETLERQLRAMREYKEVLDIRADVYEIQIKKNLLAPYEEEDDE